MLWSHRGMWSYRGMITYPGTLALKMKACESMVSHVFIALLVEFIFSYYMYEDQNEFKRDHFWSKRKSCVNHNFELLLESMKQQSTNQPLRRKPTQEQISIDNQDISAPSAKVSAINWKRILLLIIAITIHNIPGKVTFKTV